MNVSRAWCKQTETDLIKFFRYHHSQTSRHGTNKQVPYENPSWRRYGNPHGPKLDIYAKKHHPTPNPEE